MRYILVEAGLVFSERCCAASHRLALRRAFGLQCLAALVQPCAQIAPRERRHLVVERHAGGDEPKWPCGERRRKARSVTQSRQTCTAVTRTTEIALTNSDWAKSRRVRCLYISTTNERVIPAKLDFVTRAGAREGGGRAGRRAASAMRRASNRSAAAVLQ